MGGPCSFNRGIRIKGHSLGMAGPAPHSRAPCLSGPDPASSECNVKLDEMFWVMGGLASVELLGQAEFHGYL